MIKGVLKFLFHKYLKQKINKPPMQGALEHEEQPKTALDKIKEIYENRVSPSELFKMDKMNFPGSFDIAINRLKINMTRFAFYYILMFAILDFIFIFFNRCLIVPIIITAVFSYLYYNPVNIRGYETTQNHVIIACVALNLLIFLISSTMRYSYVYFFALNSFWLAIVCSHGSIVDTDTENEVDKV